MVRHMVGLSDNFSMRQWAMIVGGAVLVGIAATLWHTATILPLVGIAIVGLFIWRPYVGYVLLVLASMLTHYRFAAGIGHWRPEQLVSVFAVFAYARLRGYRRLFVFDRVTWAFIVWVIINGVASMFAPQWFQSEKIVAWLVTDVMIFIFVREVVRQYGVYNAFIPFWIGGLLALSWGIGERFLDPTAHQGRAMGTMEEPDVFGTFAVVLMIFGLGLSQRNYGPVILQKTRYLGIVISFAAALLSGTRSSLAGLMGALVVAALLEANWRKKLAPWAMGGGAAIIVAVGIGVVSSRFARIADASTLSYRVIRVRIALRGFLNSWQHVLLGHGTNAYGQFHLTFNGTSWVPDYLPVQLVTVLYDTGVMGAIAFSVLVIFFVHALFVHRREHPIVFGSLYAAMAMFVAYQATNGIWFGFTWIVLALGIGAIERVKGDQQGVEITQGSSWVLGSNVENTP